MTDTALLEQYRKKAGVSVTFLCSEIGISRQSWYDKANNKREFKASEIEKTCTVLHIPNNDRPNVFFA